MAVVERHARPRGTLAALVLASVTLVALDAGGRGGGALDPLRSGAADLLTPARDLGDAVLSPVRSALSGAVGHAELEEENAALRARVEELAGSAARGEAAEREAAELRRLHDVGSFTDLERVTAQVVAAPVSNFEQSVALDRGSGDGIGEGMPVVTGAGLVGRVVEVSRRRAVVRLLTDADSALGVRVASGSELGVVDGGGPGRPLSVGLVEVGTALAAGDLLVTSGIEGGSALPAGIPVGRLVGTGAGPGELEQSVRAEPVADLDRLGYVEVLRWPG